MPKYANDCDVLPLPLVKACRTRLMRRQAVWFRDGLFTESELLLGVELAQQCREALNVRERGPQYVYFKGAREHNERAHVKRVGFALLRKGHSVAAVADALGLVRRTVELWGDPGPVVARLADTPEPAHVVLDGMRAVAATAGVKVSGRGTAEQIALLVSAKTGRRVPTLLKRARAAGRALADLSELPQDTEHDSAPVAP